MFKDSDYSRIISLNITIITIIAIAYLMKIGSSIILPFVIALLISFGIISVSGFFYRMGMNKFFSFIFSGFSFFIFFFVLGWIINTNINEITKPSNITFYQERLESLSLPILEYLGQFNIDQQSIKEKFLTSINFSNLFSNITGAITSIIGSAGLIIVYIIFILLEYRFFKDKIGLMSGSIISRNRTSAIISKIKIDVKAYFMIKTFTSFLTCLFSYITLISFGVDFALFWSFVIFVLNYIPTIGSILGVFIVSIFVVIQFQFQALVLAIICVLSGIQIFIGNILEPRLMGNRLNLSPLVIILSLGLWGSMWGVIGMLLAVPIMVIINIVLAKFEYTKPISILLSEKGVLDIHDNLSIPNTKKEIYRFFRDKFKKKS